MFELRNMRLVLASMSLAVCGGVSLHSASAQELSAQVAADSDGMETLLRGPLHAAYAEPMTRDVEANGEFIINKTPPEPIDEIPAEAKPEDPTAVWIPGYWGWDADRDDFFWISGIWRIPPPDRRWVPGYWHQVGDGYAWVSGMWVGADQREISYLPYPPASLDEGPNVPAPADNYYWISGCWMYQNGRYAWRPGYWTPCRTGWMWNPSYYSWTPRGAVFINGYWDYTFTNRGCVFAPVYFNRPIYRRPGFFYSPNVTVHVGRIALSLFVQPRYRHYFWGDYYGPRYSQAGFVSWIDFGSGRGYDPILGYNRALFRQQGIDYAQRLRGWHDYYVRHEDRRPPQTLSQQITVIARGGGNRPEFRQSILGLTVSDALSGRDYPIALRRVNDETRRSVARSAEQLQTVVRERVRVESTRTVSRVGIPDGDRNVVDGLRPGAKLKLPETPLLVAPRAAELPVSRRPPEVRYDRPQAGRDGLPGREGRPDADGRPSRADLDGRPGSRPDLEGRPGGDRRPDIEKSRPDRGTTVPPTGPGRRIDDPRPDNRTPDPRPNRESPREAPRRDPRPDKGRDRVAVPETSTPDLGTPNVPTPDVSVPNVPTNPQVTPPSGIPAAESPRKGRFPERTPRELPNRGRPEVGTPETRTPNVPSAAPSLPSAEPRVESRDSRPLTTPRENLRTNPANQRDRLRSPEFPNRDPRVESKDSRPLTTPRESLRPSAGNETGSVRPSPPRVPETRAESKDSRTLTVPRNNPRPEPRSEPRAEPRERPQGPPSTPPPDRRPRNRGDDDDD